MKTLILIRHAKSSWDVSAMKDFDRPLNERGHYDAKMMAQKLADKDIEIDAFVSSTANRAFTTCRYFAGAYNKKQKDIFTFPELYHAPVSVFYNVISRLDDVYNCVAIFSHNPGITAFVNGLTEIKTDNMPTCGVFAVNAEIQRWKDFEKGAKKFRFFDYPKLKE